MILDIDEAMMRQKNHTLSQQDSSQDQGARLRRALADTLNTPPKIHDNSAMSKRPSMPPEHSFSNMRKSSSTANIQKMASIAN